MIAALFDRLVDALQDLLPDFGDRLAIDSKAIPSWASRPPKNPTPDGRRDWDADYGKKEYRADNETTAPSGPKSRGGLATNSI